ncbi:MAG: site-specific DNA-methyltransferase [Planctomycetales bacterium]|nr:site-specific DNA-methyltransferase [Planctomycetales bacterium]
MRKNEIHQGDCVKLLGKLKEGSADLVFADPPFNIGYEYDVYDDSRHASDYLAWSQEWISGVYRALKPDGTFWLAIGDEYAAELKIEAQKAGFHCRSWVIWYYTFGVNCVNGFSRSHTHLFHFVKDPKNFTFNRFNPQIRVKSARQLVYGDNRANPLGRLPDNTWILRPQDAPESFSPNHDTWFFARVAGTFKEREGFHGCQMPEQLLARIIRASSMPQDLVLDPFSGSGTTVCVAKKLGRQWMGFELSEDYVSHIKSRLAATSLEDPIDGPADPIESAPATAKGRKKKGKAYDDEATQVIVDAYQQAGMGYPSDHILCDPELNAQFVETCRKNGGGGHAIYWNRGLLSLRKTGKLPRATKRLKQLTPEDMNSFGFASEVAWRLMAIDYHLTLDNILCSPECASEFDRLAKEFGPQDREISSLDFRRAAVSIRKRSEDARTGAKDFSSLYTGKRSKLDQIAIDDCRGSEFEIPGVFVLRSGDFGIYAGESDNIRAKIEEIASNDSWRDLHLDNVVYVKNDKSLATKFALKSALVRRENPVLNCRLLIHSSEFPESVA